MKNLNSNDLGQVSDLTPELEWLLGSHQFSPAQVAEALVRSCFQELYRWMLLCLEDEDEAAASALGTVLAAAENAYRYPGDTSALAWVFRLGAQEIRQTWRRGRWSQFRTRVSGARRLPGGANAAGGEAALREAIAHLPESQRLGLCLACGLGWDPERVAQVLDLSAGETAHLLEQAIRALGFAREEQDWEQNPGSGVGCPASMAASLRSYLERESGPGFDLDELARRVAEELGRQAQQRSRSLYWKEILWLAGTAGMIALLLWAVNLWLPDPQGGFDPAATRAGPLAARTPVATALPAEPTPDGPIAIYQVQPGDTLASAASFLGVPVDELRRMNPETLRGALQPGQALRTVLRPPGRFVLPTPVVTTSRLKTPLDFWLTPRDFVDWLIITPARWTTVWLDGAVYDYGPPGVIRPPDRTHFQAWFSKPDRDLVIRQGSDLSLSRALTLGEWQYTSDPQAEIEIRRLDQRDSGLLEIRNLVAPGRTFLVQQPDNWRLVRVETLAGRRALIVDWIPGELRAQAGTGQTQTENRDQLVHDRLWFDTATGVILRWQELVGEPDQEILVRELVVDHIQYDQDFSPADRFSPWALDDQAFLDQDSDWLAAPELFSPKLVQPPAGRQRLAKVPPGPGFDPSTARLQIQLLDRLPPHQQQAIADVFAGSAYLGQIVVSDPERMLCVRSSDGRQIAYTYDPFGNPDIMGIGWFRLEFPLVLHRQEIPLIPDSLAFSPNGRYLAYFASPLHASPGRLALIDLQTGRSIPLAELIYATSLAWGPDGQSLAMIVADPEPEMREVRIFDLASRTFTYRQKVSVDSIVNPGEREPGWPSDDWPARDWGVDFPAQEGGLQACLQP